MPRERPPARLAHVGCRTAASRPQLATLAIVRVLVLLIESKYGLGFGYVPVSWAALGKRDFKGRREEARKSSGLPSDSPCAAARQEIKRGMRGLRLAALHPGIALDSLSARERRALLQASSEPRFGRHRRVFSDTEDDDDDDQPLKQRQPPHDFISQAEKSHPSVELRKAVAKVSERRRRRRVSFSADENAAPAQKPPPHAPVLRTETHLLRQTSASTASPPRSPSTPGTDFHRDHLLPTPSPQPASPAPSAISAVSSARSPPPSRGFFSRERHVELSTLCASLAEADTEASSVISAAHAAATTNEVLHFRNAELERALSDSQSCNATLREALASAQRQGAEMHAQVQSLMRERDAYAARQAQLEVVAVTAAADASEHAKHVEAAARAAASDAGCTRAILTAELTRSDHALEAAHSAAHAAIAEHQGAVGVMEVRISELRASSASEMSDLRASFAAEQLAAACAVDDLEGQIAALRVETIVAANEARQEAAMSALAAHDRHEHTLREVNEACAASVAAVESRYVHEAHVAADAAATELVIRDVISAALCGEIDAMQVEHAHSAWTAQARLDDSVAAHEHALAGARRAAEVVLAGEQEAHARALAAAHAAIEAGEVEWERIDGMRAALAAEVATCTARLKQREAGYAARDAEVNAMAAALTNLDAQRGAAVAAADSMSAELHNARAALGVERDVLHVEISRDDELLEAARLTSLESTACAVQDLELSKSRTQLAESRAADASVAHAAEREALVMARTQADAAWAQAVRDLQAREWAARTAREEAEARMLALQAARDDLVAASAQREAACAQREATLCADVEAARAEAAAAVQQEAVSRARLERGDAMAEEQEATAHRLRAELDAAREQLHAVRVDAATAKAVGEAASAQHAAAVEASKAALEEAKKVAAQDAAAHTAAVQDTAAKDVVAAVAANTCSLKRDHKLATQQAAAHAQARLMEAVGAAQAAVSAEARSREDRLLATHEARVAEMGAEADEASRRLHEKLERLEADKRAGEQARAILEAELKNADEAHRRSASADRSAALDQLSVLERRLIEAAREGSEARADLAAASETISALERRQRQLMDHEAKLETDLVESRRDVEMHRREGEAARAATQKSEGEAQRAAMDSAQAMAEAMVKAEAAVAGARAEAVAATEAVMAAEKREADGVARVQAVRRELEESHQSAIATLQASHQSAITTMQESHQSAITTMHADVVAEREAAAAALIAREKALQADAATRIAAADCAANDHRERCERLLSERREEEHAAAAQRAALERKVHEAAEAYELDKVEAEAAAAARANEAAARASEAAATAAAEASATAAAEAWAAARHEAALLAAATSQKHHAAVAALTQAASDQHHAAIAHERKTLDAVHAADARRHQVELSVMRTALSEEALTSSARLEEQRHAAAEDRAALERDVATVLAQAAPMNEVRAREAALERRADELREWAHVATVATRRVLAGERRALAQQATEAQRRVMAQAAWSRDVASGRAIPAWTPRAVVPEVSDIAQHARGV